jgi:CheY-like chemotaxis protein
MRQTPRTPTAQAGFDHHLTKPVDPDALTRLLASLLGRTDAPVSGSAAS